MFISFWGFLTVGVVFGSLIAMSAIYLGHKRALKQLELEALKYQNENFQAEVDKALTRSLASRNGPEENIIHEEDKELIGKINF